MCKKIFSRLLVLLLLSAINLSVAAQNITVTGTVVDPAENEPLIGATIRAKGTSAGVATDIDGNYSISVPPKSTLIISSIGYETKEIAVDGRTHIDIQMTSTSAMLDEVVVIGYGVQRKSDITGSISSVSGKDVNDVPVSSALQALQGKASGVNIIQNSGAPGGATTIKIRGTGTVNDADPLYVVDGFIVDDINHINPNDIANIEIFKDAASSAVYGARAANGVVAITTKGGEKGKVSVTFDGYVGFSNPWKKIKVMDTENYAMMLDYINGTTLYSEEGRLYQTKQDDGSFKFDEHKKFLIDDVRNNAPANWWDAITQTGVKQQYNVAVSGGNDNTKFMVSGSYYNEKGIVKSSDYQRFNVRMNLQQKLTSWLDLIANLSYANEDRELIPEGQSSVLKRALYQNPMVKTLDDAGLYWREDHPLAQLERYHRSINRDRADMNLTLSANWKWFNYQFKVSYYTTPETTSQFTEVGKLEEDFVMTDLSTVYKYKTHTNKWEINNLLTFNWNNKVHSITALVGQTAEGYKYSFQESTKKGTASNDPSQWFLSSGFTGDKTYGLDRKWTAVGVIGRVNYNVLDRYLLQANIRMDGSSKFAKNNRWGTFWSVGGAWLINKESWFDASWVQELKLKASIGSQGNDNIGDFLYTDRFNIINSNNSLGTSFKSKGTKDITWETNTNFNIGAEFQLWNRVTGSIEYYRRKTSDMLFSFTVAPSLGYASYMDNVGNMVNSGVEMDFNVNIFDTRNFTWDVNVNISTLKNRITMLDPDKLITTEYTADGKGYKGYSNGSFFIGEDLSMFTWRLKEYAGVNEKGESLFYKNVKDEAGNITGRETTTNHAQADYYITEESSIPKVYGGFGTKLKVYGVDFGINFTYQIGGKQYDGTYAYFMSSPYGTAGYNYHKDLLNSWTPENTNTNIPRFQMNDQYSGEMSTRFLTNASFLNIQNINVGYTLPSKWTRKLAINSLRVYMSAENVFYWSKRKGFDPRQSYDETTNATFYSPMRTISGGVSFEF